MATDERVLSDLAVPPGELLAETLETLGLSQAEVARRMDRPTQAVNEIVKAKKAITPETAIQLERVLGVPAHVWLGLEVAYRQTLARRADRERLLAEVPLARAYPYAAMAELGWVPRTRAAEERAAHLLGFFGVASLSKVPPVAAAAAYRVARGKTPSLPALVAWLRKGELDGRRLETQSFEAGRLRDALPALRPLTMDMSAAGVAKIQTRLAECGIALVFVPHLPGTHASGATRWLSPDKALIQMSIRGKWADILWFSLFHELGHVLLHGRAEVFIEWEAARRPLDDQEREADQFARDSLIPPREYDLFLQRTPRPAAAAVADFACRFGVHPGIVVGRLQHDRKLPHSHLNGLRMKLTWSTRTAV